MKIFFTGIVTITDENMKAVERIVMCDRQISVRRVTAELRIPKTTVHDIMNNWLAMSKVCIRWVPKLLAPLQRANRVDCCHELLRASEEDPVAYLSRIVIEDESLIRHYHPLTHVDKELPAKP